MNLKNILSFSIGPFLGLILSVILLPLTTWTFSPENIASVSIFIAILNLSFSILCLGQDRTYLRWYYEYNDKFGLKKLTLTPLFILSILLGILLASNDLTYLSKFLYDSDKVETIYYTYFSVVFAAFARMLGMEFRLEEKGIAYSLISLIPKITLLVLIVLHFVKNWSDEIELLLLFHLVSQISVFIYVIIQQKHFIKIIMSKVNFSELKEMILYGLPLLLGSIAYWALTSIDRFLLKSWSGLGELASYSVAISFASAAVLVQTVFSTIWSPAIYKKVANDEDLSFITDVINKITVFICFFVVFVAFLSPIVSCFLPPFYDDVQYLLVSSILCPLLYTLSEATFIGIGIKKKSSYALLSSIFAFLTALISNSILIPILGAKGAAISTALGFYIFFIFRTELSCLIWKKIPRKKLYLLVNLITLSCFFHTLLAMKIGSLIYIYWIIVFITVIFIGFKELKEVQLSIKKVLQSHAKKYFRKGI
ncbi:oligosaccharide flippase family protein [Vibrio parahaemolyticus]|nr:oligosaccharide flippase family protein [Vibrio parahaemolyticus]